MVNGYYYFTPNFDPYLNMAVDEWLFDSICRHTVHCRAALRLYSWLFPAITIGYNQDFSKITSKEYLDEQLPVIRRITGGRAIYHEPSEITFSLSAGLDIFPAKARTMSCTTGLISESIVEILCQLGIKADWTRKSDRNFGSHSSHNYSCFNSLSKYEIVSSGVKIAGGAQRRRGAYFIYQGSIKISGVTGCPSLGQLPRKAIDGWDIESRNLMNSFDSLFPNIFSRKLNIELFRRQFERDSQAELSHLLKDLQKAPLMKR